MHLTHGLFVTWTQKSHYIYRSYITIFTQHIMPSQPNPLLPNIPYLVNWRTSFFAHGDKYPSTLVSSPLTTAPPFACPPTFLPPHHNSNTIIYIDDINNLVRLRPGQVLYHQLALQEFRPRGGGGWCVIPRLIQFGSQEEHRNSFCTSTEP